jgi:hypothetical protein
MLDDLELPQVQHITTVDHRAVAAHTIVGHDGSVLQNLGRHATEVVVHGVATGPQADDLAARLDATLRDGTPVSFVADITADVQLERVVVIDLSVAEVAGHPDRVAYGLTLREFTEPPAQAPTGVDNAILGDAAGLVEGLTLGIDGAAAFAETLSRTTAKFGDLLARLQKLRHAAGQT